MAIDTARDARIAGEGGAAASVSIIDTDVHHGYREKSDLYPYLPQIYRERLADYGFGGGGGGYANNGGLRGRRADAYDPNDPGDDGTTALDVDKVRTQLLDGAGVDLAILTGAQLYSASAMPDVDYASALCRAFNDFTIEHWLAADDRFRFALAVCAQDPAGAAREIERLGGHPGVVAIVMPCGATRPYGNRFYRPIYEACTRHNLPVALHFNGEGAGINPAPTAAGFPSYYVEIRQARPSFYQVHLASFIFEGVFETFPTLKLALLEGGFGWVPAYRWKMDADWKGLRHQTPWVKRLPSEYLREHVRFASQPIDEPDRPEALPHLIEWMDGDRTLMFASDYPHWDWDDPARTFTTLPAELRRRIFVENARETFGV